MGFIPGWIRFFKSPNDYWPIFIGKLTIGSQHLVKRYGSESLRVSSFDAGDQAVILKTKL